MSAATTTAAAAASAAASALPSGITAPLETITDTDKGGLVAILSAFALSLICVSFPIRIYVRSKLSTYKSDDWAFLAATIFAVLQSAGVFYAINRGLGKSIELIPQDDIVPIQKASFCVDILYIITLFFTKLSTAFLFLRLTPGKGHSIAIWSTIALTGVWALISTLLVAIRCHPADPWLDTTTAMCRSLFERWQFIAALDMLTEAALFSISLYLIWGIQMSLKSKTIVVTAFGCRLPVIALAALRLHYIHVALSSSNPTLEGLPEANSVTQIEIGYAILASIVPTLKNFMAAYEAPISSVNWYQHYASEPPTGYAHELGSVATSKSQRSAMSGSVPDVEKVREKVGTGEEEGDRGDKYKGGKKGVGARMLSERLGRLRPEQVSYEARVDAKEREREGERSSREEGETRSIESINSRRMIIKKGVEWSVDYDRRSREADEA